MSTYPHRYGDTDRARQHYATACVASAKVLRSEGLPRQAADLEAEARHAHNTHLERPDATADQDTAVQDTAVRVDDDEPAPEWWR